MITRKFFQFDILYFDSYVVETTAPDGEKYYRVRVGQMSSLKDAEELKKRLDKLGYPTLIYP